MKNLKITLPRDRGLPGSFDLLDETGHLQHNGDCLGKADNARAADAENPSRDPVKPYGDTPSGDYRAAHVIELDPPHPRMGKFYIPLIGATGDAQKACFDEPKRIGLAVHAGRGDSLIPTYGCIRFKESDMQLIARLIGKDEVVVSIKEG